MGARLVPVNYFDQSTDVAVFPSANAAYPITNLQSNARDRVWRSPNLNRQVILGSWGGNARRVSCWGMWPEDVSCLLGAKVLVQLYATASYATEVYNSGTLDFFTFTGTGWGDFTWGSHPWGVEVGDRTARLNPLLRYFTAVSAGSFSITITNGGAMDSSYIGSRRFMFGDYVEAPWNILTGAMPAWRSSSEQQRSIGGALRRLSRARWRELRCEIAMQDEADRAAWMDLCYAADPGNEIVFSAFQAADGARLERDFTVLGSLEVLNPVVFEAPNFHKLQLAIVES